MSEPERKPDPIDDWLARYDDALLRGETPPNLAGVEGADVDPLHMFLDMLDQTLGSRRGDDVPPTIPGGDDKNAEADRPRSLEPIGRFLVEEELGRGGFGIVYRAFDPTIGRCVALKVPRVDALTDPSVRRRFLREAHAAAQLDHPNLVPVYEVGEAGRVCYIASSYCEGPTLRRWIRDGKGPTDPRAAARLVLSLARGVEHMHARGLLHCDLKPENVLLDLPPDGEPIPRVTDFGLARLADAPVGESTAARVWGTPPYMAPEQIEMRREAIGPAADVYALGAILYELLTGRTPHRGKTTWELMRAVVSEPPAPPRSLRRAIPRDLDAIAMRCLEKRPDRRYPDAAALVEDLVSYLGGYPTVARPLGRVRRVARWSVRNPAAAALLALGAVTLAVSVSYSLALRRAVDDLNRANNEARAARDRAVHQEAVAKDALARVQEHDDAEQRASYVAILALAQQELDRGRLIQAQRLLRGLIPAPGAGGLDRRDFAWHYLWRQSRRECTALDDLSPGGDSRVTAADGLLFASVVQRGGGVWRITRPPEGEFPAPSRAVFEFDGLAPAGPSLLTIDAVLDGRIGLAYTEDGGRSRLLTFGLPGWDPLGSIEDKRLRISNVDQSGDGRFAIGLRNSRARKLYALEVPLGDRKLTMLGVPDAGDVVFNGDSTRLVSLRPTEAMHQYLLEYWDVVTGHRVASYLEPVSPALAASPLPGGPIATGTLNGLVAIRKPLRGEVIASLPSPQGDRDRVSCVAFSPDGKTLAAGYNGLAILWDFESRREISRIDGLQSWTISVAFLGASPADIAIGLNSGEVIVWHAEPTEPAVVLGDHADEVWAVGFADGGRSLVSLDGDKLLRFRDAATCQESAALEGHDSWPSCLAASKSGDLIATGDFGGDVLIWDAESRTLSHHLKEAHSDRVRAVAVSSDGRWAASGGRDRRVRLWDARSGIAAGSMDGHEGGVRGLAFRPDGALLASADEEGAVRIWDLKSCRQEQRMDVSARVSSLVWSPDGRLIAAGDTRGAVTLWDAESGEVRTRLANLHRQEVDGLAFSPDGRVLAAGGQDKIITLIDVATGRRHLTLTGHEGGVNALAFSPDGSTLASASHDKTIRLWWAGASAEGSVVEMSRLPSPGSGL